MSGLQNFLAPFSHLLFANRNLDIVVLCFVLFLVALYALTNHWRADRLERDLASSRSSGPAAPVGRRYAPAPQIEESVPEPGGLPPVKGGRSYARNLGSALQKAGMSGPQIYSPPTPQGFAPNANNPMQQAPGQPAMGQPYAPPTPWGAPPSAPAPWAYPAGAGRGVQGRDPGPAPFYTPQPSAPPAQPPAIFPPQPPMPGPPPGGFAPPAPVGQPGQPGGPFAAGPFGAPTSGPPVPPAFAPPGAPPMMAPPGSNPAGGPAFPLPPLGQPPVPAEAGDGGRRGKPKRRRFNFNVLENLEKMVQSKPAEPTPQTGWTPPVAPVTPPMAVSPAVSGPPAGQPAIPPVPSTPAGAPKPEEAPTLPFMFGEAKAARPATSTSSEPEAGPAIADRAPDLTPVEPPEAEIAEPPAAEPAMAEAAAAPEQASASADDEPEADAQVSHQARPSMRSMMFGEEIATSAETPAVDSEVTSQASEAEATPPDEATAEPESSAASTDASESVWPSYPWEHRAEASSSVDTDETPVVEPSTADAPAEEEQVVAPEPWKPSVEEDSSTSSGDHQEATSETASGESTATEPDGAATAGASEGEASGTTPEPDSSRASAGTLVIIEDDQTAASYYATLFRGNGYEVEVANDGVSGVDLCAKVQPQVILLDVMMPRQNGILVLQTLRASDETKNTPVVVMSNFSEPTLIKRAIQLGALEYVIKTQVEGPALLNALPRWMNREKAFAAA